MMSIREAMAVVEPFFDGYPVAEWIKRHEDEIIFYPVVPPNVLGAHPVGVDRTTGKTFIHTSAAEDRPDWYWDVEWEPMQAAIDEEEGADS